MEPGWATIIVQHLTHCIELSIRTHLFVLTFGLLQLADWRKDLLFPSWWLNHQPFSKKTCSSQIGSSSPGFGVKIKLLETTMLVSYNTKKLSFSGTFFKLPFDSPPYGEGTTAQEESWRFGFLDSRSHGFFSHPKGQRKTAQTVRLMIWYLFLFLCFAVPGASSTKWQKKKSCM